MYYGGYNPIDVKIDDVDLGVYQGTDPYNFQEFTTPSVSFAAGSHTLYFIGTNPSYEGHTQFVDNVSVVVTGPSSAQELSGNTWPSAHSLALTTTGIASA